MSTSNKKTCLFVYLLEKWEITARTSAMLTKTPVLLHISLIGPPKVPTFMLHSVGSVFYLGTMKDMYLSLQPHTLLIRAQNGTVFGWEFCYVNKAGSISSHHYWSSISLTNSFCLRPDLYCYIVEVTRYSRTYMRHFHHPLHKVNPEPSLAIWNSIFRHLCVSRYIYRF